MKLGVWESISVLAEKDKIVLNGLIGINIFKFTILAYTREAVQTAHNVLLFLRL